MHIVNDVKNTVDYGYAHYSGKSVTENEHEILLVPQSIADGWQAFCSCGHWMAFASFYDYQEKEELLGALKAAYAEHVCQN